MAQLHHRVVASILLLVFLGTTLSVSGLVIWQMTHKPSENPSQTAAECTSVATGKKESVPKVAKVSGDIKKLKTTDIVVGKGQAAELGNCLQVKYVGVLAKNGKRFETNFDQPMLFQFQAGIGNVIPAWNQGLMGMKVGGVRRLEIPSEQAYGSQASDDIPANSDLVFVVKLVSIKEGK